MTRKALLITLLGVSLPVVIAASPQTDWERAHPPRPYRHVGTNPRGTPVLSWRDALNYMQYHPRFQQDLTVLLPQGLTPQMRQAYWPRIVDEVRGSVEVAQAHHFMNGTCTLCASRGCSHCVESEELSHRFQRLAIPRGTRYLALTEGRDGRVTFNRIFLGDAMAYRVNVLGGRGYIDLIARCRNTALGQRQEWEEYTAFTPPPAGTPLPPPAIGAPPAIATAPTPLPVPTERVAGSLTTNNYYPAAAPPMAYIGPGPAMSYPRGYEAGSLTLWFQPSVNVRINQASPTAVSPAGGTTPTGGTGTGTGTPSVVVGPGNFNTPVVPAGSGSPVQSPVTPAGSVSPTQTPTGSAAPTQTPGGSVAPTQTPGGNAVPTQAPTTVTPAGTPQIQVPPATPTTGTAGTAQTQAPR